MSSRPFREEIDPLERSLWALSVHWFSLGSPKGLDSRLLACALRPHMARVREAFALKIKKAPPEAVASEGAVYASKTLLLMWGSDWLSPVAR